MVRIADRVDIGKAADQGRKSSALVFTDMLGNVRTQCAVPDPDRKPIHKTPTGCWRRKLNQLASEMVITTRRGTGMQTEIRTATPLKSVHGELTMN